MNKLFAILAILLTWTEAEAQTQVLFDDDWEFSRNGKTVSVNLPHDWDIYTSPDSQTGATGTGGGWFQGGKGEYKKTFRVERSKLREGLVKLHFEGVYQKAEVFVNGQKAGQHAYGFTPFTVDATPYIKEVKGKSSELNEVVVKVDNSEQPNCRWYSGSGIYRHVWLQTLSEAHISDVGIAIHINQEYNHTTKVGLQIPLVNEGKQPHQIDDIEVALTGGDFTPHPSNEKARQSMVERGYFMMKPKAKITFGQTFTINHPRMWSPDDPYLYEAIVRVKEKGRVIEEKHLKFGIRTIEFDAEKGFVLNGKPLLINGACVHHDNGILGAMAFDAAEIRKVRLMKEAGFNLIRTSHNPPSRAFLDACDSLGMLVIDEAFDGWRSAKSKYDYSTLIDSCYKEDITAMMLRDRHHPSIISWSIGNEVIERKDIRVVTTARKMKKLVNYIDNTRPVTEALCAWDNDWEIYDPHAEVLDVVGYNYMIHKHATDHERDPQRVMWQTESYPRDAFKNWMLVQKYPYIVGDIVWTGLDYLGESGIGRTYYEGEKAGEHWVAGGIPDWHGAYCGDVDITGWRKPISHYREMLWNSSPSSSEEENLYMAVREPDGYRGKIHETSWSVWPTWESWNWQGGLDRKGDNIPSWEGKPIDVEVYTKSAWVNLYLNDELVGNRKVDESTQFKATFTLPYKPGTLKAVNAQGQKVTLSTAGEPAQLRLTADRSVMTADGQDLAFITVEVVDCEGRVCPDAAIPCEAIVKGQGQLLAFASADLKDREPKTSAHATTWKGRALLVIRSGQKKGSTQVSIKSSLPTASLLIKER
ncbi:MAG: DUF4982 domain-containing protein [Prevotella sp.]|nr:DUF4982 domain-containing protein [Prevotella sp.]